MPPSDVEAERWVIGSILLKPALLDDLTDLQARDFYDAVNAAIVKEILSLHTQGQPVHIELLKKHLGDDDWVATAREIITATPVSGHIHYYLEIVRNKAGLRRLRDVAENLFIDTQTPKVVAGEALNRSESALSAIRLGHDETDPVTLGEATLQASAHVDKIQQRGQSAGVLTGLLTFDTDMGGLFPGELSILAARPGIGKTSLALQIADHISSKGNLVYFASLEMSAVELSIRLACSKSGVSNRLVRTGRMNDQDNRDLSEAMNKQSHNAFDIHDKASLTITEIRRQIRKRKKHDLTLAIIDYLQLITAEDRRLPREQQVATITKSLKEMAREFEIPILCLCQLNRQAEGEESPKLSHLRESGAVEQDSDMVLFLAPHTPTDSAPNNASLVVAKNRNGEIGPIPLDWHPSETRFTCTEPSSMEWAP